MSNIVINGVIQHPPTTQSDVTASRALGTVYQNTGTSPLFVSVSVTEATGRRMEAECDGSNPPTTLVAVHGFSANSQANLLFIVIPGNYYRVSATAGTPTIISWIEWS